MYDSQAMPSQPITTYAYPQAESGLLLKIVFVNYDQHNDTSIQIGTFYVYYSQD